MSYDTIRPNLGSILTVSNGAVQYCMAQNSLFCVNRPYIPEDLNKGSHETTLLGSKRVKRK
jgi:hypothetical protein